MTRPITAMFPKGILMIGRFMLLSIFGIMFRYYDIKQHVFQLPEHHLSGTAYDMIYVICGLLLISKRIRYVRIALLIIAAIIVFSISKVLSGQMPFDTSAHIVFFILSLVLHIFFFIYISTKINQYTNKTKIDSEV